MGFTNLPLRRSIPAGILAYAVGYALTVATTLGQVSAVMAVEISGDGSSVPLGDLLGGVPPTWTVAGWLFHNVQFAPTSVPAADGVVGSAALTNENLATAVGGRFFVLYLLVPLLLVAAGYFVARTGDTYGARGELYGGASIALGYVFVAVVGAFVFSADAANSGVVASPAGIPTVFLGLVYPLVFGGLGGALAGRSQTPTRATEQPRSW